MNRIFSMRIHDVCLFQGFVTQWRLPVSAVRLSELRTAILLEDYWRFFVDLLTFVYEKSVKYLVLLSNLSGNYVFEPFGVETLRPWGPSANSLFKDLSKLLVDTSRDPRAGFYLGQWLSVAIQCGNARAASLLGTLPADSVGEEFSTLFYPRLVQFYYFSLFYCYVFSFNFYVIFVNIVNRITLIK